MPTSARCAKLMRKIRKFSGIRPPPTMTPFDGIFSQLSNPLAFSYWRHMTMNLMQMNQQVPRQFLGRKTPFALNPTFLAGGLPLNWNGFVEESDNGSVSRNSTSTSENTVDLIMNGNETNTNREGTSTACPKCPKVFSTAYALEVRFSIEIIMEYTQ